MAYIVSLLTAAGSLVGSAVAAASACPASAPLSCQSTGTIQNTCCTEAQGQILQVQFWDSSPATGPANSWTIHGLWPDNCDGTYKSTCDSSRAYTDISCTLKNRGATDILNYMETYWKDYQGNDESFWEHEWSKHGTCYSTLKPSCYTNYQAEDELVDFLNTTITLFKDLPTYQWLSNAGIAPSSSKTYTNAAITSALKAKFGATPILTCTSGELNQIQYAFNTYGSVAHGNFVPVNPTGTSGNCPKTGIKYLPKDISTTPTADEGSCG
ncbi:Ribonuclease T(2) [Ascochyta rabiei]|uniref:Ribonuclease T(2) n=1 Tax=Didymella rabiei TaxID=5454 RepID=UPI0019005DA7|nr:Ribonuclease T(2) [Ascochyta rabiei]UPX15714.1 Ribonuclease T(2) [Ascochyta rabiei]